MLSEFGDLMSFLINEDKNRDSYEVETLKESLRRIRRNLDTIYSELNEIENRVFNESELFEIRKSGSDDYLKSSFDGKGPGSLDRENPIFEAADDNRHTYNSKDFTKKLKEYDE